MSNHTPGIGFEAIQAEPSEESKEEARRAGDLLKEVAPRIFSDNTFPPYIIEEGVQQVHIKPLGGTANTINYYPDESHPIEYIVELEAGTVAQESCTIALLRNKRRPLIELAYVELVSYKEPEKALTILQATSDLISTTVETEQSTPLPPSLELLNAYAHQGRRKRDERERAKQLALQNLADEQPQQESPQEPLNPTS